MATIDKKLIHFNRKADFEARLAAGDIRNYSIVCIKDAKLIWTHGEYYGDLSDCLKLTEQVLTDAEKAQVMENLGLEIPAKVSELENDSNFVSAVDTGDVADDVEAGYVTEAELESALTGKQNTITDLDTIRSGASKGATAVQPSELASVAKSGSYNDLSNKPTIPSAVTESTVSGWGFTKNTGTYSKPSAGIPKTDLASAVQTSLGKADTALQSHQTLKTINGKTITGSGNVNTEYPATTVSGYSVSMKPNTYYRLTTGKSSLTITFQNPTYSDIVNEYVIEFVCGGTVSVPNTIVWAGGKVPTFEVGKTYLLSVVNNLGLIAKFE